MHIKDKNYTVAFCDKILQNLVVHFIVCDYAIITFAFINYCMFVLSGTWYVVTC